MSRAVVRRGLTREEAAEYCGCKTLSSFDERVRRGLIPRSMPGTHTWDRKAIDAVFDKVSGLAPKMGGDIEDEYEAWKQHALSPQGH